MAGAHLPTDYQSFIHRSRYARFIDSEGRREHWDETVNRYFDYFEGDLLEHHGYKVSASLRSELQDAVLNLAVMPSMRALMTAGEALRRENLAGYNCLGGDTLVLTKEFGNRPIGEMVDQWVHVLDGNGEWQRVQIRSFGVQDVHKVKLTTAGRTSFEVIASSGHEWVAKDGTRTKTSDLAKQISVPKVNAPKPAIEENVDYYLGVVHGLVYGDGSTSYKHSTGKAETRFTGLKRIKGYHLVACTDFEELKPYFVNEFFRCTVVEERIAERDGYTTYGRFMIPANISFATEMKRLPSQDESIEYLIGFLRGWMCADGHFGSKQACIAVGFEEKEWIKSTYTPMGYGFLSENKFPDETNFGTRKKELWRLTIDRRTLTRDDYLVSRMAATHAEIRPQDWKAVAGPVIGQQEVFCCEVPTTHSFAIQHGVITGNCSYLPIDRPRAFAEVLYILMCGTGVGFSVERQEIAKLPVVPDQFSRTAFDIVVGDSKMGWAMAFDTLITCLYAGTIPHINYDEVRPAGERLKVFGGRASGPEPLRALFEFTIRTFRNAAGRRLNSLEVHEICTKTGEIVVVGGVRRSAEISLSNLSDQRMRDAKSGNWWTEKPHLALANNSVAYTEKPDVGAFMDEWSALYRSRSGERGIFNRHGSIQKMLRLGRRDHRFDFGTNPCVTGDTLLLTRNGHVPIRTVIGRQVEVWNGNQWSEVTPFSTGVNPLVRVQLSDGTELTCTPYHKFVVQDGYRSKPYKVDARHLSLGQKLAKFDMPIVERGYEVPDSDAYSQGFYSGDGSTDLTYSQVYEPKMVCAERLVGDVGELTKYGRAIWKHGPMLPKNFVPIDAPLGYRRDWFAGIMDADGTVVTDNGDALQLSSIDLDFLKRVRVMLTTMGVQAKLNLMKHGDEVHTHPNFVGYNSQPCYRLLINQADTYRLISEVGVTFERLRVNVVKPQRDARRFVTVVDVADLGRSEETFCVTEPLNHTATFNGIVTGNCGEILLRPRGLCNLSEAVARPSDGIGDLREKVRLASILGTWQSTQTRFNFVEPEWAINANEERLLGVSLTGIYDNALLRGDKGLDTLATKLVSMKSVVIKANRLEAHDIGINPSAATTTVKPSGTVSQLVDSRSGIHHGHAEYYIRRVRGDNKDPVTQFMKDAGIPNEPDVTKPDDMTVFSFPMSARGTVTRDQVTAIQHLELVKVYNTHWSEHAVSCTISVKEHEWPAVGGWVYDHFDDLAGLSFLPHFEGDSTYAQMPYETISAEQYDEMLAKMPDDIEWSDLAHYERGIDSVNGTREFACVGNTCEIVDAATPL